MCTAVSYQNRYFGRNLDFECSYGEQIVIMPRGYPLAFSEGKCFQRHHAMIGIGCVADDYPLYFDGVNEKGLAMAGLLFSGNAVYHEPVRGKDNIPTWAFLPWVLGQCATVTEAENLLENLNLTDEPFSEELPPTPLHWMIADKERSIVVEATEEGIQVYENPVGVLTNNPPFPFHLKNLAQYLNLTAEVPENRFSETVELQTFSRGMGAFGLPGDLSSASRFVRAAFVKNNSLSRQEECISQFFHILSSVEQQRGCVRLGDEKYEITIYSSCCDMEKGNYYYKTYENHSIMAVEMGREDLERNDLIVYPMEKRQHIFIQNDRK